MSRPQSFGRQNCVMLAVLCGQFAQKPRAEAQIQPPYTFPQLVSSGRLEVQTLINPTVDRFCEAQKLVQPNILYFQGEQLENDKQIGSLFWGAGDVSDPEMLSSLVGPPLPMIVYLEIPSGEKIAQAFHSKGVPYVIYWKSAFSSYAASHFHQGLLSVVQRSGQVPAHSYSENGDGIVVLAMASTFPSIPSRALVLQVMQLVFLLQFYMHIELMVSADMNQLKETIKQLLHPKETMVGVTGRDL